MSEPENDTNDDDLLSMLGLSDSKPNPNNPEQKKPNVSPFKFDEKPKKDIGRDTSNLSNKDSSAIVNTPVSNFKNTSTVSIGSNHLFSEGNSRHRRPSQGTVSSTSTEKLANLFSFGASTSNASKKEEPSRHIQRKSTEDGGLPSFLLESDKLTAGRRRGSLKSAMDAPANDPLAFVSEFMGKLSSKAINVPSCMFIVFGVFFITETNSFALQF